MSENIADWQGTQMDALLAAPSESKLFEILSGAARDLGFEYCAYGMRMPWPLSSPKLVMLNNYSNEWQQRYAKESYLAVDPTVAHGMKSVLPLVWSEPMFESSRVFWEDARAHGLKVGWTQSSYDAQGIGGMLTLARSNETLTPTELKKNAAKMSWLVTAMHESMTRLVVSKQGLYPEVPLTAREIEVLRWTSEGKTSSEVGQIMNICERTVNFHVNNSLEKLGAVNKTACVVKAAMLHLL